RLAYKIINSSTSLLPAWKAIMVNFDLVERVIPRDVRTRWNSAYDMIHFALEHRQVVDAFTYDFKNGVYSFRLDAAEWKILTNLDDILADATLFFSRDGIKSSLAAVIPVMDDIDCMLTTAEHDTKRPRAIRAAVTIAKRTLNRYYQLTDSSDVYRIAM
ncbi:hypothetical protein BD626DRAFT_381696, partial [Schizophyllum amplum]